MNTIIPFKRLQIGDQFQFLSDVFLTFWVKVSPRRVRLRDSGRDKAVRVPSINALVRLGRT